MKKRNNTLGFVFVLILICSCNPADPQPVDPDPDPDPTPEFRPHLFEYDLTGFYVYDLRDVKSPKIHYYLFDGSVNKFEYSNTVDTSSYYIGKILKAWPERMKDPVNIADWYGLGDFSVLKLTERSSGSDSAYYLEERFGNYLYETTLIPYCGVSYPDVKFFGYDGGVFGIDNYPNKIDASFIASSWHDNNRDYAFWDSYTFNFENGTFYSFHQGGDEYEYLESDYIEKLVAKPYGNMVSSPVDFKLADAAFAIERDTLYTEMYFLDYDASAYLMVKRLQREIGKINTDSARYTLVTTSWKPMSDIISGWRF